MYALCDVNSMYASCEKVFDPSIRNKHGKQSSVPPEGLETLGMQIRKPVWREVRLPICVGIDPTPTLAKVANHAAKKIEGFKGVAVFDTKEIRKKVLSKMAVTEVWGIGNRLGKRLNALGVKNAWELANRDPAQVRKEFSILVENIALELNGEVRHSWGAVRAAKKKCIVLVALESELQILKSCEAS